MDKCYIAGKIGDLLEYEYKGLFERGVFEVKRLGFIPVSPLELDHNHGRSWAEYMREDIKAMLDCKHVYLLRNWRSSPGAIIEVNLALSLGINIIHQ